MIVLQAIWDHERLHLWGLLDGRHEGQRDQGGSVVEPRSHEGARHQVVSAGSFTFVEHDDLRRIVGDHWEALLAAAAEDAELTLRLPLGAGIASADVASPLVGDEELLSAPPTRGDATQPCRVPTLFFAPPDAIDLLSAAPQLSPQRDVALGDSFRYWSRAAELVLELLAKQRFVPAVHHAGGDDYRGYWRVVANDEATGPRLAALVASMPPVCRSMVANGPPTDAAGLVDSFLWKSVDSLVRRCLEGDELAHALRESHDATPTLPMRWLRSLVEADASIHGMPSERAAIHTIVTDWLSQLQPAKQERTFRTCLHLHAPGDGSSRDASSWRITVQVQTEHDPAVLVDAAELDHPRHPQPQVLPRPFDHAAPRVRLDIAQAAKHVPSLAPCAVPDGPWECALTLAEAYAFLRDAAPILQLEGFSVFLPAWWREDRPRLRMRLDVRPHDGEGGAPTPSMRLDALVDYDWRVALGDQDLSLDEITQLAATKEPLVRLRGRWAEAQPSDLQAALRFLEKKGRGEMTLMEALRQCYVADDLGTGLPVVGLRSHGWIDTLLNATENHRVERLAPPAGFHGQLRPYQLKGLEWLTFLSKLGLGACLADDMGLGKTIQLITLWLEERETGTPTGPTLLVVPMSLVGNWRREIERFAPSLKVMVHHGLERRTGQEFIDEVARHDVVVSTYALTHRDFEHLSAVQWYRIALDEAQNIKNPAAKQSTALRALRAVHRVALTGTPVENRLAELWSILDFLNPGYLGSAGDFRRRFAVPVERFRDEDRATRLRHLIRPFVLRRLKSDPLVQIDLPEKMEVKVFCNLTKEQAALYEAVVGDMLGQIDRAGGIQRRGLILAALTKLKQICNHPALFLSDGSELPRRSGKCERLTEMLEEALAEGDRALIFTQYRQMGELLEKLIASSLGRPILFLHGGTPRPQRDAMVEQFQRGEDSSAIFLLSLKAGGFGLNLTAANHVFHFDRWWNPAVEDQATDRAHRIGQTRRVQVHKFVCLGTLEERIDAILEKKRNLADRVIGAGEEWLTELSTDALRGLFALSRDAITEE